MTSAVTTWLEQHIPCTVEEIGDLDQTISAARHFELQLLTFGWTQETKLSVWCDNIGVTWGRKRKIEVLHSMKSLLRSFHPGRNSLQSSPGAVEYESVLPFSTDEWWRSPPPIPLRKLRPSSDIQRPYECTVLPTHLLGLIASLLQESCTLPTTIIAAREMYPTLIASLGTMFRATGILFADVSAESPLRLINDCGFLAGEIGLLALGIHQVGYVDLSRTLETLSQSMDLCGVTWREQYLV